MWHPIVLVHIEQLPANKLVIRLVDRSVVFHTLFTLEPIAVTNVRLAQNQTSFFECEPIVQARPVLETRKKDLHRKPIRN